MKYTDTDFNQTHGTHLSTARTEKHESLAPNTVLGGLTEALCGRGGEGILSRSLDGLEAHFLNTLYP